LTQRVAIFIDGSNLYHALDENCGRMDLDFGAFISKLANERQLFRAYYYNILQDSDRRGHAYQEQQKFLATLYGTSYMEVRLGTSKYRGDVMVEKGVDIMMATDLLQYGWTDKYDTGILVTGDGDFAYAIQTIKNFGRHIEVVSFPGNLSYELSQVADVLTILERSYFDELWVSGKALREREDEVDNPPPRKRRRRRRPIAPKDDTATNSTAVEPVPLI